MPKVKTEPFEKFADVSSLAVKLNLEVIQGGADAGCVAVRPTKFAATASPYKPILVLKDAAADDAPSDLYSEAHLLVRTTALDPAADLRIVFPSVKDAMVAMSAHDFRVSALWLALGRLRCESINSFIETFIEFSPEAQKFADLHGLPTQLLAEYLVHLCGGGLANLGSEIAEATGANP